MAHNKIIIVTIHQPSSKIFQMFHKAILLDKGGRLVFFGTPSDMLRYFAEAEHQHQFGAELGACPSCGTTRPEFIFDVLETPLRDLSGDIIYEENSRGQLIAARRYSPEFWRDKYEAFRLIQDVKQVSLRAEPAAPLPSAPAEKKRLPIRWHDEWTQFRTLLRRAFMSKLRNRANLVITIGVSPVLALLIATILRYSESGKYDFASAYHIPTFLVPWPDRRDVSRPDQQRGRYHSRPRRAATRAQSQRSPVVLRFLKDAHPRDICPDPMRAFCPDRELRPANPRDVLDLPGDHAHDGDGRRGAWSGHFFARRRSENGGQHRPARPDSADHHGRSPHQV